MYISCIFYCSFSSTYYQGHILLQYYYTIWLENVENKSNCERSSLTSVVCCVNCMKCLKSPHISSTLAWSHKWTGIPNSRITFVTITAPESLAHTQVGDLGIEGTSGASACPGHSPGPQEGGKVLNNVNILKSAFKIKHCTDVNTMFND